MKRFGLVWIVVVLLIVLALTSCSETQEKEYYKNFILTSPDRLHDVLLERIDLSYTDLNLTKDELNAIKKYSKYGNVLRAATYEWPGKSEELIYSDSVYDLGVDVFEIEVLAKVLGINIELEHLSFEDAVDKVESGQTDFVPGIYMTSQLENKGLVIDNGTITDFIYAYSIGKMEISNINDLEGLRIGVLKNFNVLNSDVISNLTDAGINFTFDKNIKSEEAALQALRNDELDIVLQSFSKKLIYDQCFSVNISQIFDEYASDILFTSRNDDVPSIMSVINKVYSYGDYMQLLKQDYMDMYAAMTVSTGAVFSYPERAFLYHLSDEPINVLAIADSQPYISYNSLNDEWSGISYEIWDAVATVAKIPYNMIESESDIESIINQLNTTSFMDDISAVIPMYIAPDKHELFVFSTPVAVDKFVVVGLHEAESLYEIHDLANHEVGVVSDFESTKTLKRYLPHEDYSEDYKSNDELVEGLMQETLDYIILAESEFNEYFYEQNNYDIAVKFVISDAESAIAFNNTIDGRSLQSIYNKVVPFIKSRQIIEDFSTIDTDINEVMQARNRDILLMFGFTFLVIIAFLTMFLRRLSKANKKVREIAFVNSITGLQNRTSFYNDNTLATGSLILIDLDNFKRLNDVHGHDIGDMYTHEIAQRIHAIAEEFAMQAYAMDIDNFLLLDDGTNNEDKLVSISAKILYEVTKPVRIYDDDHKLTASIGIAIKQDEKGMEELYKKVDTALFLAKERGKNRYVIASEEEFYTHRKKQFLNEQLTQETIQKEIEPYFQPKVDIRDGRIIGVEALARWNAKEQGIIYPKEIIPVLTENGTLPILDISILTKTCKIYVDWLEKQIVDKNFIVSCNMSYLTIERFDIVAAVRQIHDNIGMPFRSLEIEIRESDFIDHLDVMNDKLIELAKLGVNIAIDNFKADKTIMTQIAKLPINVIKVDKSLLNDGITKKIRELFELVSTLTGRLNLGLIIEGVETTEEIQLLKEIPIYRVQGYYYSDAIDKNKIENELRVKYIYR